MAASHAPPRHRAGRAITGFVAGALLLLPFSTGNERQVGGAPPGTEALIVPYALPALALAALVIGASLLAGASRIRYSLRYAVGIAVVYVGVVCVFSAYSPSLLGFVYRVTPTLLGFALFLHVLSYASLPPPVSRLEVRRVAAWVVASGTVLGAYYIINFVVQTLTHGIVPVLLSRTVGGLASLPWHASNVVAGVLLYPIVIALALVHAPGRAGRSLVAGVLVMTAAVLLTMSKGAIGAMLVVLAAHTALLRGARGKLLIVGTVLAGASALVLVLGDAFGTFFELTTGTLGGDWSDGRLDRVVEAFAYFRRHPWEPLGYGDSGAVIEGGAHNMWMAHLLESGPAGVAAFVAVVGLVATRALGTARAVTGPDRRMALLYLAGLGGLTMHLMVETPIYTWQGTTYFWLLTALVTVHHEIAVAPDAVPPPGSAPHQQYHRGPTV